MLRDRYAPQDLFALVPSAGLALDPVLAQLDRLLDDDALYQRVRADLATRRPQTTRRGRRSTPVEVILRLLVIKRLYGWSYEETERCVADSLVLRQFCRVYLQPVPDDTTLIRWANLIGPATVAALNDRVVALARAGRVTRGRKLRIDGTVVERPSATRPTARPSATACACAAACCAGPGRCSARARHSGPRPSARAPAASVA